jgi:large conductance mechanosensitive channel
VHGQRVDWTLNGFFKFVIRGNVVGLAVGVVIGAAFSTVVAAFVGAFLTPLVTWATSNAGSYTDMKFSLGQPGHGQVSFQYGLFVNAFIAFLLTAAAVYFLVVLPINKITETLNPYHDLSKAKRSCPECLTPIPAQAKRCSSCTAVVEPIADENSDELIEATPGGIALSGPAPTINVAAVAKAE